MDRLIALVALRLKSELRSLAWARERLLGLLIAIPGLLLSSLLVSTFAFLGLRAAERASPESVLPLVAGGASGLGLLFVLSPLVAGVAFTESHDMARLLHFPIPLHVLVASSLLANLVQPMVVAQAPLLLAVSAALSPSLARFPLVLFGLVLSFAFMLAAAQAFGLLLHGLARNRRLHDWALFAGLALGFLTSLLPFALLWAGPGALGLVLRLARAFGVLPFGWGAGAAVHAARGELAPFLMLSASALGAVGLAMLASAFLIERVYRGELSLGNAGARHGGTARMLFSSPLGALLEKDVRSAWRDPALRASLFLGFLGPALILLFLSQARSQGGFGTTVLLLGSVVGLSAFSSNPLGLERRGIALLLGFPLPRPLVLVGKNLAALLFRLPGFLTLVVAGLFTPPALAVAALVVALATFFVAAGVDNFVSILFPVAAPAPGSNPYGSASGGRGLGAALVSSVFLLGALVISAPLAFLAWLPALLGRPWLWLGTLPLTLAGAGAVYAMLIAGAGRLLLRREPELLERILGEA